LGRLEACLDVVEQWGGFFHAQGVSSLHAQGALTGLGIHAKEGVHLGHQPNRGLILRMEFDRINEFTACMRPTGHMHDSFAAHVIIGAVAIALQPAREFTQELSRSPPVAAHAEVEYRRAARAAILP
jgi:hypothetical protein